MVWQNFCNTFWAWLALDTTSTGMNAWEVERTIFCPTTWKGLSSSKCQGAVMMSEGLLDPCQHYVVRGDSCNIFLPLSWFGENGMPSFTFECFLANHEENLVNSIPRKVNYFTLEAIHKKRKGRCMVETSMTYILIRCESKNSAPSRIEGFDLKHCVFLWRLDHTGT